MERISATLRKNIHALATAKGRQAMGAFMVERTKNVLELLDSRFSLRYLVATAAWLETHPVELTSGTLLLATPADMERMSSMSTPAEVLAVFSLPDEKEPFIPDGADNNLLIALDGIQDPGNMGTIIRLADWFGVSHIIASRDSVDAFNPKCVISSLGSLARVRRARCDLPQWLDAVSAKGLPVYGTFMEGTSIYQLTPRQKRAGVIIMGNEGKGISTPVTRYVTQRITIPPYPADKRTAESLNVATATAITLAAFRQP